MQMSYRNTTNNRGRSRSPAPPPGATGTPDPATTSLLLACREGGSENDPVPQVAEAINNGANVDFVSSGDENANTALHWCAWRGAVG